jgi:hypothetical protein
MLEMPIEGPGGAASPHPAEELGFRCTCSRCVTFWHEYEQWRVLQGLTPSFEQWSRLQTAYRDALRIGEMFGKTGTGLM